MAGVTEHTTGTTAQSEAADSVARAVGSRSPLSPLTLLRRVFLEQTWGKRVNFSEKCAICPSVSPNKVLSWLNCTPSK